MARFRSSIFRRISAIALLTLSLAGVPTVVRAQPQASEPAIKAAIIINMLMFIDWPQQTKQPTDQLNICYLDSSAVSDALSSARHKAIRGKPVKVSKINPSNLMNCHALYLSAGNRAMLPTLVAAAHSSSVLLVGDSPDYFQQGVMLNLDQALGRIVFDFDLGSARKAGLQVSSKALRLARQVIE